MIHRHHRAVCLASILFFSAPAFAADAVLYRVFLRDGGSMISYGDYARVGDRVVISVPIGTGDKPQLQLVTVAESSVDWQLTERYAEAARAKHYATTRGEDDFNLLSNEVARALNEVALTTDPAKRVALADYARERLAEWPAAHYGYRATDVAQLSALLDEVVSELRVAAGQSRFDLKLVAAAVPATPMEVYAAPSLRESVELALNAARVAAEPAERVSLLESIVRTLGTVTAEEAAYPDMPAGTNASWVDAARARASSELLTEQTIDRAYAALTTRTMARATDRARRADVRALDSLVRTVLNADAKLGRARPNEVNALLAAVDAQRAAAQRFRLALDAWALRSSAFREYRKKLAAPLDRLGRLKAWLEDIRQLAGPSPRAVAQLEQRSAMAGRELALLKPPIELEAAHALLAAASGLATRAASTRKKAITSGDMPAAHEASSAAAGALMMLERAVEDLKQLTERPQLR